MTELYWLRYLFLGLLVLLMLCVVAAQIPGRREK